MTTKAKAAKGTFITRGGVRVAEVTSFGGLKGTLATADATSHDSTSAESVGTMPDAGEVSLDLLFVGSDAAQQALEADRAGVVLSAYVLTLPDHATNPTTFSFSAWATSFEVNPGGTGDAIKASCTLKISGPTTKTYAPA
jgi:hypothetical protein